MHRYHSIQWIHSREHRRVNSGERQGVKSAMVIGGAIGAPMTAFQYDFNLLPIGQQLWLRHLETYQKFPPLQAAESYNLSQVLEQVKSSHNNNPSE